MLTGERYKSITRETEGVLKGEYGATPAPLNDELQRRVLDGEAPITGRPADRLEPELDALTAELEELARERGIELAEAAIDDVLTYALFPQVGLKFLEHRGDASAFEPPPGAGADDGAGKPADGTGTAAPGPAHRGPVTYDVKVNGRAFRVEVAESGDVASVEPTAPGKSPASTSPAAASASQPGGAAGGEVVPAGLAGTVVKVLVAVGDRVTAGQAVLVVEAMKMETEISAPRDGEITAIHVAAGDAVGTGDALVTIG